MKFLDFRKYFFSYFYIIFGLLNICFRILVRIYEPSIPFVGEPTEGIDYSAYPYTSNMVVMDIICFFCYIAFLIEIVLRAIIEFIMKKFFPNFKSPFKLHFPENLNKSFTLIFNILFAIATIPFLYFTVIMFKSS